MIYLVIIYHHALLHRISRKPVKSFHRSELHDDYNIDNDDNEDKKIIDLGKGGDNPPEEVPGSDPPPELSC